MRTLGKLGASGLLLGLILGCRDEATVSTTSSNGSGGSSSHAGGSGGEGGEAVTADGGADSTTVTTTSDKTNTATGTTTDATTGSTSMGGTGGTSGIGGTGGLGGADPDPEDPRCVEFPHDDPDDSCEPKLRALFASGDQLLTFEYDAAGRLMTVGDERSHAEHVVTRYTYDDEGRVSQLENDCSTPTDPCGVSYEFSYANGGWLETLLETHPGSSSGDQRSTYDEHGRLAEVERGDSVNTYHYRSDGQLEFVEYFSVDGSGDRTLVATKTHEYGTDDLLDRVEMVYQDYYREDYFDTYSYYFEEGRVRAVEEVPYDSDRTKTTIFDDLDRRALRNEVQEVYDVDDPYKAYWVTWFAGGRELFTLGYNQRGRRDVDFFRPAVSVPDDMFPFEPVELTDDGIDTFHYETLARRARFDEAGRLEHLGLEWGSFVSGFDVLRCGGAVVETTTVPEEFEAEDVRVYYYGCDDFVLPELPDLTP